MMGKARGKVLAQNRKASHDYFIEETYEAGIVLKGTEIKSIRAGRVNMNDAHARIMNGEAMLINMHIAHYEQGNRYNHEPTRSRKLLLQSNENYKFSDVIQKQRNALVTMKLYIKNGCAKKLNGSEKGKKKYNKREDMKQKQMKRVIDRAMKDNMY